MVIACSAYGCTNRQIRTLERTFHRFPLRKPELLKKWIVATRRKAWFPTKYSFICGDHFTEDNYKPLASGCKRKQLLEDAVPSIFNFTPKKRKTKKIINKPSNAHIDESSNVQKKKTIEKPFVVYVKMELSKHETDSTDLPNNERAEL